MSEPAKQKSKRPWVKMGIVIVVTAVVTYLIVALLMNIRERKEEALHPYVRLVEVDERTTDPEVWGRNWRREYDSYRQTVDITQTRYGGSEAMPAQKLDRDPWLKEMFAGYAFSID